MGCVGEVERIAGRKGGGGEGGEVQRRNAKESGSPTPVSQAQTGEGCARQRGRVRAYPVRLPAESDEADIELEG